VIFGKLEKSSLANILDLSPREIAILAPLVLLTILFGVYPKPVMDVTAVSVEKLIADYNQDVQAASQARLAAVEDK
jgi:NADH-quinone oxidoreductase subunit M